MCCLQQHNAGTTALPRPFKSYAKCLTAHTKATLSGKDSWDIKIWIHTVLTD
jgi:hypothetical protein